MKCELDIYPLKSLEPHSLVRIREWWKWYEAQQIYRHENTVYSICAAIGKIQCENKNERWPKTHYVI